MEFSTHRNEKGGVLLVLVNIQDDMIELQKLGLLDTLLVDKTTRRHILWGTNAYRERGERYANDCEIFVALVLFNNLGVIKTRARKAFEQQVGRTKLHGEVATPLWVCNKMIDAIDCDWFGMEKLPMDAWQQVDTLFQQTKKSWKKYVDNKRLEIACGEAPYLVQRYDGTNGSMIPVEERTGILDRKLHVVSVYATTQDTWIHWAIRALEATFGYEYQGDNLLIARVNVIKTFIEFYTHRWNEVLDVNVLNRLANKVTWNLWQMDGLTDTIPCHMDSMEEVSLFDEQNIKINSQPQCRIYDWRNMKKSILFAAMKGRQTGMKFDYVIGNPPYQEDTKGAGRQARPLYNLFFEQIKNINPKSISLIIPSRWFSGGMGLNKFREEMMNDRSLKVIFDYTNAKDLFPNNSVSGGVNFFVWKSDYNGNCRFINTTNGRKTELIRPLNEFPVLVRYNQAVEIIRKIRYCTQNYLTNITSGLMPFGLSTNYRGNINRTSDDELILHATNGCTYISKKEINKGFEYLDKYKVLISKTGAEHAGEPNKEGMFRVIPSSLKVIGPNEICTHSYFLIGATKNKKIAENTYKYMKTQFVRFLMLMAMSGFGLSKNTLIFVPLQNFTSNSDIDWSQSIHDIDQQLYKKYKLTQEEINFIEMNVKEMK